MSLVSECMRLVWRERLVGWRDKEDDKETTRG
jgi:hypothetical protein